VKKHGREGKVMKRNNYQFPHGVNFFILPSNYYTRVRKLIVGRHVEDIFARGGMACLEINWISWKPQG